MSATRVAVIFYSATGVNFQMAQWAAEAAAAAGAEVRLHQVEELAPEAAIDRNPQWRKNFDAMSDIPVATPDDLVWADVVIFSFPTRFGNMASQMKQFIDTTGPVWAKGQLVNKIVSAMSSASNIHGGQESALLSMYRSMLHWGALVVTPGYTDENHTLASGGNPYGTTATESEDGGVVENLRPAVEYQVQRALKIARLLKRGIECDSEQPVARPMEPAPSD